MLLLLPLPPTSALLHARPLYCCSTLGSWFQAAFTILPDGITMKLYFIGFPHSKDEVVSTQSGEGSAVAAAK